MENAGRNFQGLEEDFIRNATDFRELLEDSGAEVITCENSVGSCIVDAAGSEYIMREITTSLLVG